MPVILVITWRLGEHEQVSSQTVKQAQEPAGHMCMQQNWHQVCVVAETERLRAMCVKVLGHLCSLWRRNLLASSHCLPLPLSGCSSQAFYVATMAIRDDDSLV